MNLIKYIIYSIDSKALNTEYDNYKLVIPLLLDDLQWYAKYMPYPGEFYSCYILKVRWNDNNR